MQQTRTLPIVQFTHQRHNYGSPRFALAKDEGDALVILRGLGAFFADDTGVRYDYAVQTPEHFLEEHPALSADSEDEYDLAEAVLYDGNNPEHVAWIDQARTLLAAGDRDA